MSLDFRLAAVAGESLRGVFFYSNVGIYEPSACVVRGFCLLPFAARYNKLPAAICGVLHRKVFDKNKKTGVACLFCFYGEGGIYEPNAGVV